MDNLPKDQGVRWWQRFLVEWAAFVMGREEFDAFLERYGLEISKDFKVIRRHV